MSNENRQATRDKEGRYSKMKPCPRCGKRRTLEPAYSKSEGGQVKDTSAWVGHFICSPCIKQES